MLNGRKSNSDCSDDSDSNDTSITKEVDDGGGDQDSTRLDSIRHMCWYLVWMNHTILPHQWKIMMALKLLDWKNLISLERIIRKECRLSSHYTSQKMKNLKVVHCVLLILFEL